MFFIAELNQVRNDTVQVVCLCRRNNSNGMDNAKPVITGDIKNIECICVECIVTWMHFENRASGIHTMEDQVT